MLHKSKLAKAFSIFGMFAIVVASFAFALNASAAEYSYQWVSQSNWPTLPAGGEDTVTLAIKNTGTATWYNSGSNPVHLAGINPQDRNSGFYKAGEWLSTNRPTGMNEAQVGPNEIATFTFSVVGNPGEGHYPEYFAPVVENLTWMDDFGTYPKGKYGIYWDITVLGGAVSGEYKAEVVSKSANPVLEPGTTTTLSVTVKNTGTATWSNSGSYPIHVGTWSSQDRSSDFYDSSWLANNRPAGLNEASVAPLAQGTFDFTVKVPTSKANGTYTETFNLVAEGKTWFMVPFTFDIRVDDQGSTGDVTVSLASNTPIGTTIPKGSTGVEMAIFKFTGDGIIDSMTIHRYGVGAATAFDNVYLYNGDTRLTNGRSVSSSTHEVEFNNINFVVNGTEYLSVVADFDAAATGQHGFEIVSSSDVNLASVGGSFPIQAELFAVGDETASTVTISKSTNPANPNVGAHAELAKFKIDNGSNDTSLERLTLLQTGDISNTDLTDLELYQGSDLLASTLELDGDKVVFTLDDPYLMQDGTSRIFTVKGTTAGRSARTIRLYLEYTSDILLIDQQYNVGAQITNDYDGSDASKYSEVTLQGGEITLSYSGPSTGDISKNGKDEVMLNFAISSSSRQVEVKKLSVTLDGVGGDKLDDGGTDLFTDIKIRETDSAYTASTLSVGSTVMGPKALCSGNDITTCALDYTDSFYVDGGETRYFQITWDVANNTYFDSNNRDYYVTIEPFTSTSFRYTDTNQYVATSDIVPSSAHESDVQTVKASTIAISLSGEASSDTVVTSQKDVPAVGFTFTTGNDPVTVTDIILTGYLDENNSGFNPGLDNGVYLKNVVQNVRLFTDADLLTSDTQVGTAKNVADDGTVTFTSLNWEIPANTGATLLVKYDVSSSAPFNGTFDEVVFDIDDASADVAANNAEGDTVEATGDAVNSGSVQQTINEAGELYVIDDGSTPAEGIILGGAVKVPVAKFRWSAVREAFKLEKLGFNLDNDSSDPSAISQVYIDFGTGDIAATSSDLSATGSDFAKFEGLNITVPKDGSIIGTVKVTLKSISQSSASSAYSGKTVQVVVNEDEILRAVGSASGTVLTAYDGGDDSMGRLQVVRKSKPTVTKQSLSSTALNNGTKEVYRFRVAADAAGQISMYGVMIYVTESGVSTTDYTMYDVTSGKTQVAGGTGYTPAGGYMSLEYDDSLSPIPNPEIGAGSYREYSIECTVSGAGTSGDALDVYLPADSYSVGKSDAGTFSGSDYFIWSDQSGTTTNIHTNEFWPTDGSDDYINGYNVLNLPLNHDILTFNT